jgi:hypothetical protein
MEIKYRLEHYYDEGTHWLNNGDMGMFAERESHIGGVTVKYNNRHFEPVQYSLAELASEYAKQGRANPSKEAYDSAKQEIEYLWNSYSVGLWATVKIGDIELLDEHIIGSEFNPAFDDEEETIKRLKEDYVNEESLLQQARERGLELFQALKDELQP